MNAITANLQRPHPLSLGSLRVWLMISFLTAALIPIALLTIWVYQTALDKEYKAVEEKHLIVAQNLASVLSRYVKDVKLLFLVAAKEAEISSLSQPVARAAANMHIRYLASFSPDGSRKSINIFDNARSYEVPEGPLLSSLIALAPGDINEAAISGINVFDGAPHFFIVARSSSGDVWIAALGPEYVVAAQQMIKFGVRGHSMIVDQTGRVVAHPNPKWEAEAKNASKISIVQKMLARETGVATFYSPPLKADMIAGHTFVPETGWGVMVPQPVSELRDSVAGYQMVVIAIATGGLLVAAILSFVISGLITRPLSRLLGITGRVTDGDMTARSAEMGRVVPAEVRYLGERFDHMVDTLMKTNANLVDERRKAETSSAAKSQFLAMMSHEIRTPMNGIIGSIELIHDSTADAQTRKFTDIALKASSTLVEILDEILDFVRIEGGKLSPKHQAFNPEELVQEVAGLFASEADIKGVDLQVTPGAEMPDTVVGDAQRVRQILLNLVGNAVKFTHEGYVHILLNYEKIGDKSGTLKFKVEDTGVGISEENQELVFEEFYQEDQSLERPFGGIGLGLAISKRLAELLGGILSLKSKKNQGSTLELSIPVSAVRDSNDSQNPSS